MSINIVDVTITQPLSDPQLIAGQSFTMGGQIVICRKLPILVKKEGNREKNYHLNSGNLWRFDWRDTGNGIIY